MNSKSSISVTSCLTEEVLARILAGEEFDGQEKDKIDLHLESCVSCCSRLEQRLSASVESFPERSTELETSDTQMVDSLVRKLMEFERRGELQLLDQAIREHLDQGNGAYPFGDFELTRYLDCGGMGSVFEARDLTLGGRLCVVKLINSGIYATPNEIRRFLLESHSAALLDHPSIVKVWRAGHHRDPIGLDRHYVVMEMVHGESLEKKIHSGKKISDRQIALWVKQVAEGLAYAHGDDQSPLTLPSPPKRGESDQRHGQPMAGDVDPVAGDVNPMQRVRIVHRDMKPSNILIDRASNAKIIDFGLAKIMNAGQVLTRDGSMLGTPAYMSPEQTSEGLDDVGPGSDIFSLGVVLYELLTGQRPFQGKSAIDTFQLICREEPKSPRKLARGISIDLETICLKCLEKETKRRYASATKLADDLAAFLAGLPIKARRITPVGRVLKWCKRNPVHAVTLALLALLCAGIAGLGLVAYSADLRNSASQSLLADTVKLREQEDYFYNVRTANFEWENNRLDTMQRILESCPLPRRNLEWYLLNNNCLHQEFFRIDNSTGQIQCVDWSPDGEFILVMRENSAEVWSVSENRPVNSFPVPGQASEVCWEKKIFPAVVQRSSTVELFDMKSGEKIRSFHGLTSGIESSLSLAIDPSARWLVGATRNKVCVWEIETGQLANSWQIETEKMVSLRIHPQEPLLVTLSRPNKDGTTGTFMSTWEIPSGKRLHDFVLTDPDKWPYIADFSADGKWLVTGSMRDPRAAGLEEIAIWDVASGELISKVPAHNGGIISVRFHPNRQEILSAGLDSTLYIWRYSAAGQVEPQFSRLFRGSGKFHFADFNSTGTQFLIWDEAGIGVWDYTKNQGPLLVDRHPDSVVFSVATSPDGRTFATGGSWGIVKLSDLETGQELREFSGLEQDPDYVVFDLAFSPDGKRLAGVGRGVEKQGVLWDVETGSSVAEFTVGDTALGKAHGDITTVAFHPDGKLIVTGGDGKFVRVWDAIDGKLVNEWPVETSKITQLAFSPDGRLCVLGEPTVLGRDFFVAICDARSGEIQFRFDKLLKPTQMAFSTDPEGRWIAFGEINRQIRVLDSRTSLEKATLTGHSREIKSIAFHPNGNRLVSCGDDKTVRIWDLESGREILVRHDHPGGVESLDISPDGRKMVTGGWGNTTLIWDLGAGQFK